jgi:hypothetical protein
MKQERAGDEKASVWQRIPLGGFKLAGRPQLPQNHAEIVVPGDGYCLWHAHNAAQNTVEWLECHNHDTGYGSDREQVMIDTQKAQEVREEFLQWCKDTGKSKLPEVQDLINGKYPCERIVQLVAQWCGGAIQLVKENRGFTTNIELGEGKLLYRIRQMEMPKTGAAHFNLSCSWLPIGTLEDHPEVEDAESAAAEVVEDPEEDEEEEEEEAEAEAEEEDDKEPQDTQEPGQPQRVQRSAKKGDEEKSVEKTSDELEKEILAARKTVRQLDTRMAKERALTDKRVAGLEHRTPERKTTRKSKAGPTPPH